jgi:PhnB protein
MTKAIPDGMHTVTPHLICKGAADAIDFYKRAFNATELSRLPGPNGRLMHAMIRIGDSTVMLVDEMPEWGALGPQSLKGSPVAIHLYVEDVDAVAAQAVRAGAKTTMPVSDTDRGSVRPSLVDCHPRARRGARRHAKGDAAANVHRPRRAVEWPRGRSARLTYMSSCAGLAAHPRGGEALAFSTACVSPHFTMDQGRW